MVRRTRPRARTRDRRALSRLVGALRRDDGQDLVELTLTLPILLIVVFGILEFGLLFDVSHSVSGLAREGANLASRGTSLDSVVLITEANGASVGVGSGGTVASEIRVQGGAPVISMQSASPGYDGRSRLGQLGDSAQALVPTGLLDGQTYFVVELFLPYRPFTPLSRLVRRLVPDTLYDRSIF